jgi:glucosamine 6-phosphate synthetase-like amidotransferase/phosphosugar isomerase protein
MIRRQEGLDGGYYTGIATIHEGRLYYAKLTGDLQHLLENTDAMNLPGNIGIIHTRTRSGGGDEWAHPFIGKSLGKPAIAYVANGSGGYFNDLKPKFNALADNLFSEGYEMSIGDPKYKNYNNLADGSPVHMSDLLCQDITRHIDEGISPAEAMGMGFCELPAEIVGLMLATKTPDAITWSRLNMPMNLGFCPHGAYLASSPTAFPEDAEAPIELPACCSGTVTKEGYTVLRFKNPPAEVPPMDAKMRSEAYLFIEEILKENPISFSDLRKKVYPRFFKDQICPPANLLIYSVLYSLQKEGRLGIHTERVPFRDGLTAPKFSLYIK